MALSLVAVENVASVEAVKAWKTCSGMGEERRRYQSSRV